MPAKKHHSAEFKAKVVLEVLNALKTINEISSETEVHATKINTWKKQAQEGLKEIFLQKGGQKLESQDSLIDQLYQQIGRLQVELDWLKKSGLDY